jgi:hypothetical protein
MSDGGYSDDDSECAQSDSDGSDAESKVKFVTKVFKNPKGEVVMARMPSDEASELEASQNTLGALPPREGKSVEGTTDDEEGLAELTDEEYLIASPVVLGFAFSEKQWLEFSVSSVKDIKWNEDAWDSLVLEPATKDLIQALVKSRKYSAAQTIDDVIQGKGKGLVSKFSLPFKKRHANISSRPTRASRNGKDAHGRGHQRAAQMPAVYGLGWRAGHRLAISGSGAAEDIGHLPRLGSDSAVG